MKTSLFLLTLMLSQTVHAQGFMYNNEIADDVEIAAGSDNAPAITRAPAKADGKKTDEAKKDEVADGCTNDFKKANAMAKAVHGKDVELSRLTQFPGKFNDFTSKNSFKNAGGSVFINLDLGIMSPDVPTQICKKNGKLSAVLVTSRAVDPATKTLNPAIQDLVKNKTIPGSIALSITRSNQNLEFKAGKSLPLTATATIR